MIFLLDKRVHALEQMRVLKAAFEGRASDTVAFRDISDLKSVEQVGPDNLAATFGPGVSLRRAKIEIVDEPVTRAIEKKLPWRSTAGVALGYARKGSVNNSFTLPFC